MIAAKTKSKIRQIKRNIFLLISLLALAISSRADNVSVQTAQRAAQSFLNSKMGGNPQIHLIDFAEKASFPNFYVFGNEHCFVIIAANNLVHPVLGYSTENGFGNELMPECVRDWLEGIEEDIAYIKAERINADEEISSEWAHLLSGNGLEPKSRSHVGPLLTTYWNQGTPYNSLCPPDTNNSTGHKSTGCTATAMAQVMNYWEHPVRGNGSHSYTLPSYPEFGELYADFESTTYDWDHMLNHYAITGYSDTEALAVATLMHHCGISLELGYGDSIGSSGYTMDIVDALRTYFDYSPSLVYRRKNQYTDSQWKNMLKTDLDLGRPIPYRSNHDDTLNTVGHAFVCDGYDEYGFFHFNWGWAGRDDGYYMIGALNPSFQPSPYNRNNAAIFNCFPNTPSISPPSNITTTVTERNVVINWTAVSDASYYKLYRDGNLIANNLTNRTYVDQNVAYGEHFYYVKSVKSDGTMSLRSNTAVVDIHFVGPVQTNLQATVNEHAVNLSWNTSQPNSSILQYGNGNDAGGIRRNDWAQRFPTMTLSDYAGMAIRKVSFYCKYPGVYSIFIYKGDEVYPRELVYQQDYQASSTIGWQEINFPNPVSIDYTKDLWVVFHADSSITYPTDSSERYPTRFCAYSGSGAIDAALYLNNGNPRRWVQYVYNHEVTYTCSWLMKIYVTDANVSERVTLEYGTGDCFGGSGYSNESNNPDFYWAHRYPATSLQQYQGMSVEKVSFYFRTAGEYTMFVYKGTESHPTELLHQQSYSYTATSGSWQDIDFTAPIPIDCTQDLWIVFLSNARRPASCCLYDDVTDARLYSYDGVTWRYSFNQNEYELRSWLIKTYLTDGTYTYNLYRNGDVVAGNLTGNTYTDSNLPDGLYDYQVTTNYFGGESDPSNTVHVQVGNPTVFHFTTAGLWSEASNWSNGTLPGSNDIIYIDADCQLDMNATVSALTVVDRKTLTLQSGKTLMVTGSLTNTSITGLIVKDGAQLINASGNVAATMEKDIASYSNNNPEAWYTIASPMEGMPIMGSSFATSEFDLYRYNESNLTNEEWENYKGNLADFTTFENGRGYLFASGNASNFAFTGTLNASAVTCPLTYTEHLNDPLSGFHLIGNPFPHVIYKGAGAAIDDANLASGFYVLNDSGSWEAKTYEDVIQPGQGILVKATTSTNLIINKSTVMANNESAAKETSQKRLNITVTSNDGKDCVYAYLGQGNDLDKVKDLVQSHPSLTIRNGDGDFAIAHFDKKNDEVELVFTSPNDGIVKLNVDFVVGDFEYLHLKNLSTGDDFDLLKQSSYTFSYLGQNQEMYFKLLYIQSGVEMNQ